MSSTRVQTSFRKGKSGGKRTYAPTTAELNEAIEDYLHEHPKASHDDVRASLIKSHESWVIPERRLNKFVKRQKSGKPMTVDDDNTLSSRKPGHRIKGLFKAMSSSSPKKVEERKKHVPTLSTGEPVVVKKSPEAAPPKTPKQEEPAPPVIPDPEPEVKENVADKDLAYVDDNDGSKGGPCAACDGCTIL